ncbi:MAG: hypothetical protein CL853_05705 [Crocinitomicaceae bacterium]|nr:hypothetical protein [Crocinitomicaceae bacterium]|tara:strand:+ start:2310 stop:3203 length:894 start_codon:yes stop_codon:yes gene_type:complete
MKENSTLDSKLKKYASLAGTITAAVGTASAQVNYTDLNPDVLVTGHMNNYILDLNADNNPDFVFMTLDTAAAGSLTYGGIPITYNVNYAGAIVYPSPGNSWAGSSTSMSSSFNMVNIPQGSSIGSNNSWSSTSGPVGLLADISIPALNYSLSYPAGPFLGTTGFMGLKFNVGGNTHYGWIRVEVGANGEFLSIKDYAFDATPNTAIVAGETGSGPVGVNDLEEFVNVFNFSNALRIETSENYQNAELSLVSISGKQLVNQQITSTTTVLNTSEIASGIYLLSITSKDKVYTKKVYLK